MLDQILRHFPSRVHALTLVGDPDNLLADEELRAALANRGFSLVQDDGDPVQLRYQVSQLGAFTPTRPVIIHTAAPLNQLPYDLWQQGRQLRLALHTFFPHLNPVILRSLTPNQRWQLSQAPAPPQRLGRQGTADYILRHVFHVDRGAPPTAAGLVAWLNQYHHDQPDPMPEPLAGRWLAWVQAGGAFGDWPLAEMLAGRKAFARFVAGQWQAYLARASGETLKEAAAAYVVSFAGDEALQDALPQLVRRGSIRPVRLARTEGLPSWAQVAVLATDEDPRPRRASQLQTLLAEQTARLDTARWTDWQAIAWTWAELTSLHLADSSLFAGLPYRAWQVRLDGAFMEWLKRRYAPLGGQRIPTPHHLHHVPHLMAYERRQKQAGKVALLVLDGMALVDWLLIRQAWQRRQTEWQVAERLLLAQVPPITAVSRQALISGRRPADFSDSLSHNRQEGSLWAAFWAREDVPIQSVAFDRLRLDDLPLVINNRIQAMCLVYSGIDDLIHGATLGAAGVQASLRHWLANESPRLETVIADLLDRGFTVYVASDHGHTEARGMGQPREGVTVETRSKRARIYRTENAALAVKADFPESVVWHGDGLLPDDVWVLLPYDENGRRAFAAEGEQVVTHGSLTLDEVVTPLARITL